MNKDNPEKATPAAERLSPEEWDRRLDEVAVQALRDAAADAAANPRKRMLREKMEAALKKSRSTT